MRAFKRQVASAFLVIFCIISAQQARAELVATAVDANFVYLTPLRNGLSAITLVWPIDPPTQDRVAALKAGLSSVVTGGTSSRSSSEIDTFLGIKGIEHHVNSNGQNLLLTVSAPDEVFPETLTHLENLLLETNYSKGWYDRELQAISLTNSSNTGRPTDVLNEVAHFLRYERDDETVIGNDGEFRFGQPSQVVLRSGDEEVERRVARLLKKLPKAKWKLPLAKWAARLIGEDEQSFALPAGTIHFSDPDSTEMLILFVKAEEFEDEGDQIGTNLLVDYVGDNSGSEMFRIIRQEMRAAYAPQSDFIGMNKNRSVISLSATVEAERWPEIHGTMKEIYHNARAGKAAVPELEIQHDLLKRRYYSHLFNDPVWGVLHYLNEYPEGARGTIDLPILEALETANPDKIIANSTSHLPPLEDFLLILIGGGTAPTDALRSNGYCALPKNTPLTFCLDVLSNTLN